MAGARRRMNYEDVELELARRRAADPKAKVAQLPVGWQWAEDPEFEPYRTQRELMDAVLVEKCARVAFWGAPGNGKTYVFLLVALTLCVTYPGYVCVVVRKNVTDLRKTFMKPASDHFRAVSRKYRLGIRRIPSPELGWRFPNGSELFVASGENDKHVQGGSYDAVFFEELAQIDKSVFQMAVRQNRGAHSLGRERSYPPLLAVNCNPSPGTWVHLEYAKPHFEGREVPNNFRVFVAKTRENTRMLERLMASGVDYVKDILDAYGPDYGELILNGSWDVVEGLVYGPMVKSPEVPLANRVAITSQEFKEHYGGVSPDDVVFIGFDHGQRDATAAVLGVVRDRTLVIYSEFYEPLELKNERYCVEAIERLMLPATQRMVVWDPNMKPKTGAERSELVHPIHEFSKLGFVGHGGGNTKNRRYRVTTMRRAIAAGRLKVVADRCPKLFWEWNIYQRAGDGEVDPDLAPPDAKNNHAMDAIEMLVADIVDKLDLQNAAPLLEAQVPDDALESVEAPRVDNALDLVRDLVRHRYPGFEPGDEDGDDSQPIRRGLMPRVGSMRY